MNKKNTYKKLFSVIFLLFLIGILLYLTFSLENRSILVIKNIEIKNTRHLTKEQYFKYANYDHYDDYKYLNLTIIRDRIIKHPYVLDAEVEFEGSDKVVINIIEKNFVAIYHSEKMEYLISDNMELVPMLPASRNVDFPIVVNSIDENKYKPMRILKKSDDLITALKIITTFKYLNEELLDNLAEIDLNNGREIMIDIDLFSYPIWIGRDNLIKKIISLNELNNSIKEALLSKSIKYVDLRYSNNIYMKINAPVSDLEENKL